MWSVESSRMKLNYLQGNHHSMSDRLEYRLFMSSLQCMTPRWRLCKVYMLQDLRSSDLVAQTHAKKSSHLEF